MKNFDNYAGVLALIGVALFIIFMAKVSGYTERMDAYNAKMCAMYGYQPDCETELWLSIKCRGGGKGRRNHQGLLCAAWSHVYCCSECQHMQGDYTSLCLTLSKASRQILASCT